MSEFKTIIPLVPFFGMEESLMTKRAFEIFAFTVSLLCMSIPLSAHHGTAVFDTDKTVTLKGSVTEWDWSNPHCLLQFDIKNDAGQVVHWIAETQNPAEMVSLGWGKASFKPGDEVSVSLMPVRNGRPYGRITLITLPDGKTFITKKEGLTPKESNDLSVGSKSDNSSK